jgi:hypothetical protein
MSTTSVWGTNAQNPTDTISTVPTTPTGLRNKPATVTPTKNKHPTQAKQAPPTSTGTTDVIDLVQQVPRKRKTELPPGTRSTIGTGRKNQIPQLKVQDINTTTPTDISTVSSSTHTAESTTADITLQPTQVIEKDQVTTTTTPSKAKKPNTTPLPASATTKPLTTINITTASPPRRPITSFSINSAANRRHHPRTSFLRAVVIDSCKDETDVVFRCERKVLNTSSWAEKLIEDDNKLDAGYCRDFNMQRGVLHYYRDNIQQFNENYPVRMFHVIIPGKVPLTTVVSTAIQLCITLNRTHQSSYKLLDIEPDTLFWLTGKVVWSDVIGAENAFDRLIQLTEYPSPGYFEKFNSILFNHFHDETFDHDLKNFFYAPDTVLHPDLLEATSKDNTTELPTLNSDTEETTGTPHNT